MSFIGSGRFYRRSPVTTISIPSGALGTPRAFIRRLGHQCRGRCASRTARIPSLLLCSLGGEQRPSYFPAQTRLRPHCKWGVMEHKTALSLAVAAAILMGTSACSDGPVAPAPVYLMGQTTRGPGGRPSLCRRRAIRRSAPPRRPRQCRHAAIKRLGNSERALRRRTTDIGSRHNGQHVVTHTMWRMQ